MALYIYFCLTSAQIRRNLMMDKNFFFVGINSCFIFSENKQNAQFEMS